jgi:hypothetical protein
MSAITQLQKEAVVTDCNLLIQKLNAYGLNPVWAGTGPSGGALNSSNVEKAAIQAAYAEISSVLGTWTT